MIYLEKARAAWQVGDYDTARIWYQKCGYLDLGVKNYVEEIAAFAAEDPVSQEILAVIKSMIIERKEPILQSEITKYVKNRFGEKAAELVRYTTYFAEVRGELHREKKGRSYLLYLIHEQERLGVNNMIEKIQPIEKLPLENILNDSQNRSKLKIPFSIQVVAGLTLFYLLKYLFG